MKRLSWNAVLRSALLNVKSSEQVPQIALKCTFQLLKVRLLRLFSAVVDLVERLVFSPERFLSSTCFTSSVAVRGFIDCSHEKNVVRVSHHFVHASRGGFQSFALLLWH